MENKTLTVAALQMSSLPLEKAKLDYYLAIAKSKQVDVLVLGEYVTNLFFKELQKTPIGLVEDQARLQKENLKNLSKVYNITIVSPLIWVEKKKFYKLLAVFDRGTFKAFEQTLYMPYPHWDEKSFFSEGLYQKSPGFISVKGFKVAIIYGFEAHFDAIWQKISAKKTDVVILPSASTFESAKRWRELCKTRAFLSSSYILRVNRVGEFEGQKEGRWVFYGDSFVVNPYGEIESGLGSGEEIMICELFKKEVSEARKVWGFQKIAQTLEKVVQ